MKSCHGNPKLIKAKNPNIPSKQKTYIKDLIQAGEDYDQERIKKVLEQAKASGYELTLNNNEIIEWEEYGNTKNATVRVDYTLQLGGVKVAEWFAEYIGEYGSMGTGWWISQFESDGPDEGITEILEAAEIEIDFPDVPEPEEIEFEDDEGEDEDDAELANTTIHTDNNEQLDNPITYQPRNNWCADSFEVTSAKAKEGDSDAQYLVGLAYQNGYYEGGVDHFETIDQDFVGADKWYRLAAEQGDTDAMYNLALLYENGSEPEWNDDESKSLSQNDAETVKWVKLAAEKGQPEAQNFLGWMYKNGNYVNVDSGLAISWFLLAANQGLAKSQCHLGAMYNLGEGVAQNYQEAMRWSKLAAAQGHTDAQFNIGWMYDKGQGVEADKKLAKHWYKIACDNGHEIGCEYLRKMKRR